MRYKKKTVLMSLFTALQFCGAVSCVEFEPKKCPELSATVYSGNNGFAVMCVKTDGYADSGLGFDYAGLSTSGVPSRDSWTTRLLLKMGTGKSAQLNFLMTFPKGAAKQSDRFLIQADDPLGQPEKLYPLPIKYADSGKLVFHSFWDSAQNKISRNELVIDMKDNTAMLTPAGKKLKVYWYPDRIVLSGLPKGNDTFEFVMPFKTGFRGAEDGRTAISRRIGRRFWWQIFPEKGIFYLTSAE